MANSSHRGASSSNVPGTLKGIAGVLTAVALVIGALAKAGVFKRSDTATPTAVASVPPPDSGNPARIAPIPPVKPEATPAPPPPELEYASYYYPKYGYSVVYPKALLFPGEETGAGPRFRSLDRQVTLEVMAGENTDHVTPATAYDQLYHMFAHGPMTVVSKALETRGPSVDLKNGTRLLRTKMVVNPNYFRVLSLNYDESARTVYDGVWTHIATAFENQD